MIDGVIITPLKKIADERGMVMHMFKRTDPSFTEFGEIYFSCGYPGAIKGWHTHKEMISNFCCIVGMIKLVIYDCREGSRTKEELMELFIGEHNYCLVQIPPMVANGYKPCGSQMAIIANCASIPHEVSYFTNRK